MLDYLAMGGYAAYVWPAYGLAALVIGGLLWTSLRGMRARERALASLKTGRSGGDDA